VSAGAVPAGFLPESGASPDQSAGPDASPAPPPQNGGQATHPRAFDASKGTPYDPLHNKTYDLNYAKTVPAIQ
jgi:UPF0755 protein